MKGLALKKSDDERPRELFFFLPGQLLLNHESTSGVNRNNSTRGERVATSAFCWNVDEFWAQVGQMGVLSHVSRARHARQANLSASVCTTYG